MRGDAVMTMMMIVVVMIITDAWIMRWPRA